MKVVLFIILIVFCKVIYVLLFNTIDIHEAIHRAWFELTGADTWAVYSYGWRKLAR